MQTYGVNELRKMFLDFLRVKSILFTKVIHWCHTMIRVYCSSIPVWRR